MPAARPFRLALAVVLLSTALSLLLAELVTRRTYGEGFMARVDPYEDHSYRPYLEYEQDWGGRTIRFHTNSLGWKDERPDHEVEKRPRRTRVLFLGDSFAEGLGVAQEDTLSGVVQRELGQDVEVLNGGRASFSPLLEYQRLKRFLQAGYRTDVVVLLYDISDVQDELYYSARYQFSETGEPLRFRGWRYQPWLRALYNHSALVRSIRRLPQQLRRPQAVPAMSAAPPPVALSAADPLSAGDLSRLSSLAYNAVRPNWMGHPPSLRGWVRDGLASSFRNIRRIERLAEENSIRLLLVIYPWPQMLYNREDLGRYQELSRTFPRWFQEREIVYGRAPSPRVTEYQRQVHRFCREHGVALLDLIPMFQADADWPRLFIAGDVHFNELGSRRAGLRIAEALGRP